MIGDDWDEYAVGDQFDIVRRAVLKKSRKLGNIIRRIGLSGPESGYDCVGEVPTRRNLWRFACQIINEHDLRGEFFLIKFSPRVEKVASTGVSSQLEA